MNNGKKVTAFTAIALLTTGLTACNGNEGALNTRDNNNIQPMGYHTNENGNRDNEGPVTEMMDGMNNGENNNQRNTTTRNNRTGNNNNQGNTGTTNVGYNQGGMGATNAGNNNQGNTGNTRNTGNTGNTNGAANGGNNNNQGNTQNMDNQTGARGGQRYSHGDANYHGHLNQVGYYNRGDGEMSDKVRKAVEKMDNVDNANVLVTDNNIIVAIDTDDKNDKNVKDKVTSKLRGMADGRNIQVVTDEGTITRIRNINNNIENGKERKTIDTDVNNLMNDLGDAVQRPFNGNRD